MLSHLYYWQGPQFYYRWTKAHRGQLPSIARLADDGEWGKVDQGTAYSEAASFLAYLLETDGPGRLKQLFPARSDGFADRFAEIYGRPLATVEEEWLAFCDSQG